jgi:hypothetical protein
MSLRGTKISRSITFELSTSSAFSSSAENVTNWPRSYSYPLKRRRREINRARHQRKTQKTAPARTRHQRLPARPSADLQSISYRKANQVTCLSRAFKNCAQSIGPNILWLTHRIEALCCKGWGQFGATILRHSNSSHARAARLCAAGEGTPARYRRHQGRLNIKGTRRSHRPSLWADGTSVGFRENFSSSGLRTA